MKKMKILFAFMFFSLILPLKINASCTYSQKSELKKMADNINISYVYNEQSDNFDVTITNINPNIYIYDIINKKNYTSFETLTSYKQATTVKLNIQSNLNECKDELISIKYINIPFYNIYYNDPLCSEDIKEFSLCQKWVSNGITSYDDFKREILNYKKNLDNKNTPLEVPSKNTKKNALIVFLLNYYYYILIFIIVICLTIMYREIKKDSFGF